jgi:hypothetical protein
VPPLYGDWVFSGLVGPAEDPGPGKFTLADYPPNGSTLTVHHQDMSGRDNQSEIATLGADGSAIHVQQRDNPALWVQYLPGLYAGGFAGAGVYLGVWMSLVAESGSGLVPEEDTVCSFAFVPATVEPPAFIGSYATPEELARILLIPTPTPAQSLAMTRVLNAAATEITAYLGLAEPLVEPYPDLVVEVNLERAVEHWKQEQSPFGIIVLGGELPPGNAGANAWRRHARTLLPLKESWGVA